MDYKKNKVMKEKCFIKIHEIDKAWDENNIHLGIMYNNLVKNIVDGFFILKKLT